MNLADLRELEWLETKATPGPWHVRFLDDRHFMTAVVLSIEPDNGKRNWPDGQVVAATLIQEPRYVDPLDGKWIENAKLIAVLRNAMPELLRLARTGLAIQGGDSSSE